METELRPRGRRCSRRSSHLGRQVSRPGGALDRESASPVNRSGPHCRPGHKALAVGRDGGGSLAAHHGGAAELTEAPAGVNVGQAGPSGEVAAPQMLEA
eukprot:2823790-Pyramimonas_sp.AAC.1